MLFLQPRTLAEALALKADNPDAVPLAGGTDLMVDINFDRRRPDAVLDLTRVGELRAIERPDGYVRLGAGVTYTRVLSELSAELPGLALASRTVGSPQIRNRGTVGGNLGTASPAGDALPPLVAAGAGVEMQPAEVEQPPREPPRGGSVDADRGRDLRDREWSIRHDRVEEAGGVAQRSTGGGGARAADLAERSPGRATLRGARRSDFRS